MIKMVDSKYTLMELDGKLLRVDAQIYEAIEELRLDERPILVEGKRDEIALERLGVDRERILKISFMPLHKLLEKMDSMNCKSVINLLDYDREGERMTRQIRKSACNIELDERFRKVLFVKTRTSFLEGLPKALKGCGKYII